MKINQRIILTVIFSTLLLFLPTGCGQKVPLQFEKIVLGAQAIIHLAPVWVAEEKGYFKEEGLNVVIKEFTSGRASLKTMLDEKNLDLTTTSQSPVIFNSFVRNDFAIIGGMVFSEQDIKILVRLDRGIKTPKDLKGRTVGVTKATAAHFFLSLFLTYHQMPMAAIKMIDLEPPQLSKAMIEGRVDAIVTWEPHIYQAGKVLGNKALLLPGQGLFRDDIYFIARKDYLKNHSEALKRFLRAVEKADSFIVKNNREAMEIVGKKLKMNKEETKTIWNDLTFKLFLDQSILISLEDQARWAIRNKLTDAGKIPNYLSYLDPDLLMAVKPEAVRIAGK